MHPCHAHLSACCCSTPNAGRCAGPPGLPPSGVGCRARGTCLHGGNRQDTLVGKLAGQALKSVHQAGKSGSTSQHKACIAPTAWQSTARHAPSRSTCCGVAHSGVNTSSGSASAMGRKEKMPPPALFTSTTVSGGRASPVAQQIRGWGRAGGRCGFYLRWLGLGVGPAGR